MILRATRFSLPDWVGRTLWVAAPGRPLSPSAECLDRAASLCPASGALLLGGGAERSWAAPWSAWGEP